MIVYHYTNIDNLENIVTKNDNGTPVLKLHVTNCKFLNDQYENILGLTIWSKCLPKIEEELNVPLKDRLSLLLKNKAGWEKRRRSFTPKIGRDFYVFSTSKERDSLVMWSAYGNKGNGVAIGLDWDILRQHAENEEYQGFSGECTYWTRDMFDGLLDSSSYIYRRIKAKYREMTSSKVRSMFLELYKCENDVNKNILQCLLSFYSTFHKTEEWKNEREYRCMFRASMEEISFYKNIRGDYIPYISIELPITALREIIIGPACGKNANWMALSLLVKLKTYELPNPPSIHKSRCPLQ